MKIAGIIAEYNPFHTLDMLIIYRKQENLQEPIISSLS